MSININGRNLEWAVKTFRPLLKDLEIPKLKAKYNQILTSEYKIFNKYNMSNCVIIVSQYKFSKPEYKGVFVWQYSKEEDFYALYIVLNSNLFENTQAIKIVRKAVSTHEFVHCVAALMTLSRLKTQALIENLHNRMKKKFHALTDNDVENIFKDLKKSLKDIKATQIETFPDEHFRVGGEDFIDSYSDLYRNLLLSYELFCSNEFFNIDKKLDFFKLIKDNNMDKALNLILKIVHDLEDKKALDFEFIIHRVREEFLPKIQEEMKSYK